jgi:MFS family permease
MHPKSPPSCACNKKTLPLRKIFKMENHKRGNLVLLAGVLFNLSVGVLYAWSVLKTKLIASVADGGWGWSSTEAGLPYTVAIVFFAVGLLVGGRIQDKIGPRWVVTTGGALVGLGMILSGYVGNSVTGITVCFGFITGIGIGLGYGCVTPPALKWFHPSKKGLISGLIVGGFGIAPVYFAPVMNVLLNNFDIQKALLFMGIAVAVISIPIAQFVKNPPVGYIPQAPEGLKQSTATKPSVDITWKEMVKTKQFYLLFTMLLLSSSVGLMIIGNMSKIANTQIGITNTALLAIIVSFLAITNTAGRVFGGLMSDKIGRVNALFVVFALQSINMAGFVFYQNLPALIIGIVLVGFSYGTLLSVFPSMIADLYGLKNYGTNFGVLYLSWGLAGVVAPIAADIIYDLNGNFHTAYVIAAIMMVLMVGVNALFMKANRSAKHC